MYQLSLSFRKVSSVVLGVSISLGYLSKNIKNFYSCNEAQTPPNEKKEWNFNWDNRHEHYLSQPEPRSQVIHQIILIRHGQYNQLEGDHNRTLTELGVKQAIGTGKRLNDLIEGGIIFPVKNIYYSTMTRATETWLNISNQLNQLPPSYQIQPCSMIREGAVCKPIPSASNWKVSAVEFPKDNQRVEAAFMQYFHRPSNKTQENYSTMFVCHGNVIRYLVLRALQLPPEAWLRTSVWNASITILELHSSGKVSLRCLGDIGHLPVDHITYN